MEKLDSLERNKFDQRFAMEPERICHGNTRWVVTGNSHQKRSRERARLCVITLSI